MVKNRLDHLLTSKRLVSSRSQAESYIKLGAVYVDGKQITKPGYFVDEGAKLELKVNEQYVSRAGLKLASVANVLKLDFKNKIVLDVGSSTGGFTDYALQHGAKLVYAVDVGTNQLHKKLHNNPKIELHEQTNILDVRCLTLDVRATHEYHTLKSVPDLIMIDVSFVSLRDVLPHIAKYLAGPKTQIVAMLKPQFEAGDKSKHKGVIKNNKMRREILANFEIWAKKYFVIQAKSDSDVAGAKGNQERFYLLRIL